MSKTDIAEEILNSPSVILLSNELIRRARELVAKDYLYIANKLSVHRDLSNLLFRAGLSTKEDAQEAFDPKSRSARIFRALIAKIEGRKVEGFDIDKDKHLLDRMKEIAMSYVRRARAEMEKEQEEKAEQKIQDMKEDDFLRMDDDVRTGDECLHPEALKMHVQKTYEMLVGIVSPTTSLELMEHAVVLTQANMLAGAMERLADAIERGFCPSPISGWDLAERELAEERRKRENPIHILHTGIDGIVNDPDAMRELAEKLAERIEQHESRDPEMEARREQLLKNLEDVKARAAGFDVPYEDLDPEIDRSAENSQKDASVDPEFNDPDEPYGEF